MTTGVADAWKLLEHVCVHDSSPDESGTEIDSLLAGLDWNQLTVIALTQRMLPRLADFLLCSDLMNRVPKPLRRVLVDARHALRCHASGAVAEADRVARALADNGVTSACTKGVVFHSTLYNAVGGRPFEDIDFMIHPDSADRATATLLELGYLPDKDFHYETDTLVDRSRRELAMYRLFPDHLPHFHRPVAGHVHPYLVVDVCFNITWYGAAWHIPMDEVLAEVRRVKVEVQDGTVELPTLAQPYDLVFAVMHLFREAWFERTINSNRLMQYGDIWRLWDQLDHAGVVALSDLVDRHAVAPPVAWVAHHVDQLFGSAIVSGLGLADYCDDGWLHSACAENGTYLSWTGDMRARLRTVGALPLTPAPEPVFAAAARAGLR